jgi:hypothetical protein
MIYLLSRLVEFRYSLSYITIFEIWHYEFRGIGLAAIGQYNLSYLASFCSLNTKARQKVDF